MFLTLATALSLIVLAQCRDLIVKHSLHLELPRLDGGKAINGCISPDGLQVLLGTEFRTEKWNRKDQ